MNTPRLRLIGVMLSLFWIMQLLCVSIVQAQESTQVPSWLVGQPTFNGTSYETVPDPVNRVPISQSTMALPASMPVGQNTSSPYPPPNPIAGQPVSDPLDLPSDWQDNFGLSPSPLQPPVLNPTGSVDASIAPLPDPTPLTDPDGSRSSSIAAAIDEGVSLDEPPLEEEVVRWYQVPWRWMTRGWENHAEFGLDGSSGNADTLAIQTGLEMKRKTDAYTLALDFDYRQASANNQTTEDNGRFNLDYDRLLGDTNWSAFGKFGMEFDEFKAFDLRLNLNGGVGYYWLRNDKSNLVTRFGAGASKEIGAVDDDWIPEAVFGLEADHQLTARQKVKAKVDYFPAWTNFAEYRLVTDLAWETLLDSSDNLSLRIAVTDRYDSTPQGAKPNDFYYSVLLLYKF